MDNKNSGIIANLAMAYGVLAAGSSGLVLMHEPSQKRYRQNRKLNRSNKWPYAESYADARAISPEPHKPVR